MDRALADAEESRRLNLRALGTPAVGPSLREGVDALEHSSVSMRTLFRAIDDATRQQSGVRESPDYVDAVRGSTAFLMRQMGNVILAFGRLLHRELERSGEPERSGGKEQEQLAGALEELDGARREVHDLLLADPRSQQGLWGLNSTLLTTADRLLIELGAAVRTRQRPQLDPSTARRRAMQAAERLRATHPSPCPPHRTRSLHRGPGPVNRIGALGPSRGATVPSMSADDVAAEVLAAEDRRYEALLGPDLPTLEKLFHDRLSYAHSSGVRDTKAEYLEKIESGYYDYARIDHPVERVDVVGDTALVVGRMTADLTVQGTPKTLDVLALAVWTKATGDWQLIAYASTPLPRT